MITKILIPFLILLSTAAFGRSPAVEPVTGISIEEYKEVSPKQDPGFNWQQRNFVIDSTILVKTREPAEKKLINQTKSQRKSWPTYLFLFSLVSLPFALWYSIMKGLENKNSQDHYVIEPVFSATSNTVDLNKEREKRKKDEEDHNIPKAS
ncbi:MAG: hypothetical protein K9K67_05660 [Bacteriovoracaceae bacterium]|nr:hypothetical protein [Bacteriovoracaceae bacterium]